jgi:predicted secreted acid phosphatase
VEVKLKLFQKVRESTATTNKQINKQTNKQKFVVLVTDETLHKGWSLHIMNP